ncbi:hypothetical protein SNE40_003184 [Patella caerulea]|uniref:Carbohydrate deacetylase n=1 Tax=Patella caerulea TaxID=87958 RepID=A0AAN8KDQ1_PATCE
MKRIIITADDFGYSKERNMGIVECFLSGTVTTISLLVNGIHCDDAIQLAAKHNIPLERIGLHLNLSEGTPLSLPENVASLLNKEGFFRGKAGFCNAVKARLIKYNEVKLEIQAQIDKYHMITGRLPLHVDGHQHVHVTDIREIFSEVLKEYGINCTRQCGELNIDEYLYIDDARRKFYLEKSEESKIAKTVFRNNGIWCPDYFVGLSTSGADLTIERLKAAITKAYNSNTGDATKQFVSEIMVHPGYCTKQDGGCGCGPDDFSQIQDREHEMDILKSDKLKMTFSELGISLISYCDIQVS